MEILDHLEEQRLYNYLEGLLAAEEEDAVEQHLEECYHCTRLAREYSSFLEELAAAQAVEPELDRHLPQNVVPLTYSASGVASRLEQLLLRHGVRPLDAGDSTTEEAWASADEWAAAAAAAADEASTGGNTARMILLEADGTERQFVARLMPGWSWSEDRIDLAFELPPDLGPCRVTVTYDMDEAEGRPQFRSIGPPIEVDESGFLQFTASWPAGVPLPDFDPGRLRLFVVP